ncbi:MAG: hypothetical protein J0I18_22760, partial [Actinobacteria bacterium]|nr:hypothetical protein [Actinomycetota bacterium]
MVQVAQAGLPDRDHQRECLPVLGHAHLLADGDDRRGDSQLIRPVPVHVLTRLDRRRGSTARSPAAAE